MYGAGGQKRVPDSFVRDFIAAWPPVVEQRIIATFLDRETAKIDALVAEQRRLMELLKEKRQAVISHAVTKGLNPDAPMKDSGSQVMGDIPDHWTIRPLRRLAKRGTSITYGIVQAGPDVDGGIPYIRTSDMSGDSLPVDGYLRTTREIDKAYSRSKVQPNDLVVAIRATLGKGLLVPGYLEGANLTQGTAKVSPGPDILPRYLYWAFNSQYCQESVLSVAKGSTFLEITLDALRRICLAVPPILEQEAIVAYLDEVVARLDYLATEARSMTNVLAERRQGIVSAAVTGQIDVRGLASVATA
jgi:type I restriction enzyme S subunit